MSSIYALSSLAFDLPTNGRGGIRFALADVKSPIGLLDVHK